MLPISAPGDAMVARDGKAGKCMKKGVFMSGFYEVTFVARPDVSRADITKIEEDLTAALTELKGKVKKSEYWGLRSLAYRINKNTKGHYSFMGIEAPAEAVHELDRLLRINENVVRHLVIRVEALEEEPSAPLRTDTRDAA
jgi:small subunit ribosomal protein S6